jgi:hypothetical protein
LGSILLQESGFSLTARKYSGLPAYDLGQVAELINLNPTRGGSPLSTPRPFPPMMLLHLATRSLDPFQMKEVRLGYVIFGLANPSNHARP